MNKDGYRLNGGIGFSISSPILDINFETSNTIDVIDKRKYGFNEDERKAILVTISQFVLKVLSKDKRVDSLERANYEQWKERMGIA